MPVNLGANTLSFVMPADTGANFDAVNLESYTIVYPRAFVARQGKLQFDSSGAAFKVSGFENAQIVAYRIEGNTPVRLTDAVTQSENGAYTVSFAGTGQLCSYWVSTVNNLLRPTIAVARPSVDITSGSADYIMISHPNFITGLSPLVERRTAQGYTVKVVDVFDIYAQFSNEIFDPQAIRAYIAHAYNQMGTRYILLVGGDSYDYKNYLGLGQSSFIPTLYTATDQFARFAPVDPLYTDVNGDNQPDLAIGRFPVRDANQLNAIIAKTLAYEQKDYQYQTVFSSDISFLHLFERLGYKLEHSLGHRIRQPGPDDHHECTQCVVPKNQYRCNPGQLLWAFISHSLDVFGSIEHQMIFPPYRISANPLW